MPQQRAVAQKKVEFVNRVVQNLQEYNGVIVFNADNVSAHRMKLIRKQLYGQAEMVMGKNTLFLKSLEQMYSSKPQLKLLEKYVVGNIGMLFTNESLRDCRAVLETKSENSAAKAGQVAQCDVILPKGVTSISPDKTSFFQSLNISTMINKGFIEIMSDVHVVKAGAKVGESEATLLQMMNMKPFNFCLQSLIVYDFGDVYTPEVLDISQENIVDAFNTGISTVTAVSLAIGHTTKCSVRHCVTDLFRTLIGISLDIEHDNKYTQQFKNALASAAAVAAAAPVAQAAAAPSAGKKEAEPEPEEEEDEDLGLGLFD